MNDSETSQVEQVQKVVDLVDIAGRMPASTVVVAGGDRVEDLLLVESARDHGIVDRIILVGAKSRIEAAVAEVAIEVPPEDIVAAENDEQAGRATVELIRSGAAGMVLKGGISTPVINRHMLPLAIRPTVSLTSVFDAVCVSGGRPIILTDAGVTTVCNFGRMTDLIRNSVDVARLVLGIARPRVAVLSANEKQVPSLPSTWMGLELAKRSWPDAVVCGPLSFDLATDPESVSIKGMPHLPGASEVAGKADILVCPGIDTANAVYKTIAAMTKVGEASIANITVGFPVPYVILSRSDSVETRLASIALSAIYSHRSRREEAEKKVVQVAVSEREAYRVLTVNPGSMSMKVARYEGERCTHEAEMSYEIRLGGTPSQRAEQVGELTDLVAGVLAQWGDPHVDAVAGRGGFLPRPAQKLAGGAYIVAERGEEGIIVDEDMVSAVLDNPEKEHASNYGAPVSAALAHKLGVPAFVVDPVVVDEFVPEAELSGYRPLVRRSTAHALSIRAAARRAARDAGRPLEDLSLVVAHLGGGITVAAVRGGKIVDNNIALLGGGPFTPQRAGELPLGELIDFCYSGRFTREDLVRELTKHGGLMSYLGTDRMEEIEQRVQNGDEEAKKAVNAMVYQIAKEIGRAFVAAGCDVEAIVLTGGLTRSALVRSALRSRVIRLAPVVVYQGSLEMGALAAGVTDVMTGRQQPLRYSASGGPGK